MTHSVTSTGFLKALSRSKFTLKAPRLYMPSFSGGTPDSLICAFHSFSALLLQSSWAAQSSGRHPSPTLLTILKRLRFALSFRSRAFSCLAYAGSLARLASDQELSSCLAKPASGLLPSLAHLLQMPIRPGVRVPQ